MALPLHALLLLSAAVFASAAAIVARNRSSMPGRSAFVWAMVAVAYWSFIGTLHSVIPIEEVRVRLAQAQYLGIVSVAPLWLMFAAQYSRTHLFRDRMALALLWTIPAITLLIAVTNDFHHLLWSSIEPVVVDGSERLVYHHGPWFWAAVVFNYGCLALATLLLLVSMRRFPLPYRRQTSLFVASAVFPWFGNALYLGGALPPGVDITPVGFAASAVTLLWGFYQHELFGLVPIARDLVVESMDEAVIVLDPNRHIVDFNPAAERVAGCSRQSIGRSIDEAVPWWTRAAADGAGPASPALIAAGNRFLEVEVKPVRDEHELFAGWLVVARDVSAVRQADFERMELDRRIQDRQRMESLSVLAGGVAHDFNNLLTGILGNADLMAMKAGDEAAVRKSAEEIVLAAQRAADLVSKILAYAGEGRVIAEMIDLDAIMREIHELLQASVAQHCRLEYESDGSIPLVKADPTQARQVLMNLIINASEAVDDGGTVRISGGTEFLDSAMLSKLTFSSGARPGLFAYVRVSDDGPGIDRTTQARIFEPFYTTKQGGRGLGLAAVQGIVRSHRGALHLTSQPGRGTTFTVWFPIEAADTAKLA